MSGCGPPRGQTWAPDAPGGAAHVRHGTPGDPEAEDPRAVPSFTAQAHVGTGVALTGFPERPGHSHRPSPKTGRNLPVSSARRCGV